MCLAYRALPYAFSYAGREMPADLQIMVESPRGGEPWIYGPGTATQRITGTASEWARVAVQHMPMADAATTEGNRSPG